MSNEPVHANAMFKLKRLDKSVSLNANTSKISTTVLETSFASLVAKSTTAFSGKTSSGGFITFNNIYPGNYIITRPGKSVGLTYLKCSTTTLEEIDPDVNIDNNSSRTNCWDTTVPGLKTFDWIIIGLVFPDTPTFVFGDKPVISMANVIGCPSKLIPFTPTPVPTPVPIPIPVRAPSPTPTFNIIPTPTIDDGSNTVPFLCSAENVCRDAMEIILDKSSGPFSGPGSCTPTTCSPGTVPVLPTPRPTPRPVAPPV
eukprot:TRINITY_DN3624_c0_g1_i5.p1 TRINITY_DN3624_c0_g1~~TRINITY_DN3624_c0_g1_i5.p1  ORF type:complete len:256 (-),score=66.69 TRINITY_DN3624_c0_g1_i5:77-844(-)